MEAGDHCQRLIHLDANHETTMKAHILIAALLATLAHAKPFPPAPKLNELVATAAKDRKHNAPYYAESPVPSAAPAVMQIGRPVELPVLDRLVALPVKKLPAHPLSRTPAEAVELSLTLRNVTPHPAASTSDPVDLRTLVPLIFSKPSALMAANPVRTLPGVAPMTVDPFRLKLEFIWEKPHGQWMNQLLKDINAAKAAGDIETYNALTARYAAWANKYLRQDDPPDLDGLR
jgi:hypothetical protein